MAAGAAAAAAASVAVLAAIIVGETGSRQPSGGKKHQCLVTENFDAIQQLALQPAFLPGSLRVLLLKLFNHRVDIIYLKSNH